MPGRYHANMTPCLSIKMLGFDILTSLDNGGYRFRCEASFCMEALLSRFLGAFESFSE
jgi:hypothetical protein